MKIKDLIGKLMQLQALFGDDIEVVLPKKEKNEKVRHVVMRRSTKPSDDVPEKYIAVE